MFNKSTLKDKLKVDIAISSNMSEGIELWGKLYINEPPWLSDSVKSLNLPSAIASEIARLTTIEMKSDITGSPRADYLNKQYKTVLGNVRRYCEYGCAKGGLVFKPYVSGKEILVDTVQADCFFPVAFDSKGNITSAIFIEQKTIGKQIYTRLEYHALNGSLYTINNTVYVSDNKSDLGRSASLESVAEWATLQPEVTIQNIDRPLFSYFKTPQANTVDTSSPLGVSVYSRAVDLLEQADKQYSRLLWEMEGSELAVHADITTFDPGSGMPKLNKRLFKSVDAGMSAGLYEVFSPTIRDQSILNGLNELLMRIEDVCGLARGTFSNPVNEAKTATELKILRQRSYATVADTQKSLQNALEQLIYAMDILATLYKLAPQGKYEASFEWDDSIVTDTDVEFSRRMQMAAAGMMKLESVYAWYFGCSEKEALKRMPPKMAAVEE